MEGREGKFHGVEKEREGRRGDERAMFIYIINFGLVGVGGCFWTKHW